ncbi:hypothetical protein [Microvirga terricola]|uniref:Transcriptional regulator n=1 Tax=Microvirga terricola TaxID=2719797 RepID=A0ABX0VBP0_9HYPH|nr:hypothetical protein [Microvirga terricola]NIX77264.1 hypothetical protein [Microvirga terricola]
MKTPKDQSARQAEKKSGADTRLDEALEETFPASDPVAVGHSEHAGSPPNHKSARRKRP